MDDEQRKYFASIMGQLEGVAGDARAAASASRETAATVRRLDQRVGTVEGHVVVLQRHVFGSDPPPLPTRPIAESVGDHDNDIATMSGQLIAVAAKVDALDSKVDGAHSKVDAIAAETTKAHAKVDDIAAETTKQTSKLGLEPASAVLAFIRNANVKDVVKVLTLIAAIIAAWRGLK